MALGATNSTDLAYKVGMATGQLLKHVGINMNYGPVCDINSEPLNPVIGVRSPGDDPDFVGRNEILGQIHEKASIEGSRVAIIGIGGVG